MNYFKIVLIGFIVISCGDNSGKSSSKNWDINTDGMSAEDNIGDWMIIHELSDVDKLNRITSTSAGATYIEGKIFETLVEMDNNTLLYTKPALAESLVEISPDHLEYIYHIKKNAYYSDGTPIDGNDFIFFLKCIKNPFVDGAHLRNYYKDIKKAELVNGDPYTLKITCSQPYFRMELMLNGLCAMPAHHYDPENIMEGYSFEDLENLIKETANKDAIEFEKNPAYKFAKYFNSTEISRSPLGSGPYVFKEWVTDDKIVLERNPDYWGYKAGITEKGYVEKFVHKTVKDYDAALTGIKAGELDILRGLPMEKYKHQTNSKKIINNFNKELFYIPSYGYIGWNMKNPLFKSKKVRRAMTQLLDREQILETLFYGEAQVCKSPIYFKRPEFHSEITPLPFNTEKAKELLYEEGWIDTDGDGILDKTIDGKKIPFKFTVLSNSGNEVRKQIGLILAENCRKVGIKVDVQQLEWSIFLDQVHAQKFEAIILGWVMPITHPDPYQIWHSSQSKGEGSNYVSFINKRADEIIEKNRQEFDMNKRIEYMREFQEILHEEQPYTFVYVTKSNMLFHKRFSDAKIYPYRPGYDPFEWWVPSTIQKYTVAN